MEFDSGKVVGEASEILVSEFDADCVVSGALLDKVADDDRGIEEEMAEDVAVEDMELLAVIILLAVVRLGSVVTL